MDLRREIVAAYTVIQPKDLRNVVMADIQAAAIAHQTCDVCQAGCTAHRRIVFSCGHSVCDDCISRLAKGRSVTCSQCRRVASYRPTDDSSHNAMLSLVKVRMSCDIETTLGAAETHAKRCLRCMSAIAASLLQDSASSLATLRAREDKIKRLSQDKRRLQQRNEDLRENELYMKEAEAMVSSLQTKVENLRRSEQSLLTRLKDGYIRENHLRDECQGTKNRVARLTAKLQTERRKSCDSQEKAERAMSTLAQLQQASAAAKKRQKKADSADAARQKKRQKIKQETATDRLAQGGGSGSREGGGGGASRPAPCERCMKKGFSCTQVVLSSKKLSCDKCRGSRVGCSFRTS